MVGGETGLIFPPALLHVGEGYVRDPESAIVLMAFVTGTTQSH